MAEQATDALHVLPRALAEPTEPVTKAWIGTLGLASLVMWMASITPLQVLIPEQLQNIDPHGKILALGLVSAFGAVSSLLATPVAGALSDRTTHAYSVGHLRGRRHRWTLAMAILSAVSLALIAPQNSVLGVGILWVLFSAFQNGEYASLSAAVPDHVPVNQRATVAGWVGMPQALGLVVGTAVVVYVFTHSRRVSGVLAVMCIAAVALAIVAGRMAVVGLVCAGVPGASQQLGQAASNSYNTLVALQSLGILVAVTTVVLLVLGGILVRRRRHRYLPGQESEVAESR